MTRSFRIAIEGFQHEISKFAPHKVPLSELQKNRWLACAASRRKVFVGVIVLRSMRSYMASPFPGYKFGLGPLIFRA
jgi:hypothetical protein